MRCQCAEALWLPHSWGGGACFFGGQMVKVKMLRLLSNPAQGLPTVNVWMNKRILL